MQICRTAYEIWQLVGYCVQYLAGGNTGGQALGIGGEGRQAYVPAIGQGAIQHALQLIS